VYDDQYQCSYWVNTVTNETSWEDPAGSASGAAVSSGAGDYAEAAAPTDSEWATYYDDSGYPYYFNAATGESTYDPPPGF
jgi:hypothetical protein